MAPSQSNAVLPAPAVAIRQFLLDLAPGPTGLPCSQLRAQDDATLYGSVAKVIDWLLPSDFPCISSRSLPPSPADLDEFARDDAVRAAVYQNYLRLLVVYGLAVDHHGWVFGSGGGMHSWSNPSLHDDVLIHMVRCLAYFRFGGYSVSNGAPGSLDYADGLAERLDLLWARREQRQVLSSRCNAARARYFA